MTTNTEGPLPCPFCGHDAESGSGFSPLESVTYAWCGNLDCPLHDVEIGFTVAEWNRRPTAQASEAIRNAALEEAAKIVDEEEDNAMTECYSPGLVGALGECAERIRALSTMPVEPVTNPHFAIQPEAVDTPLAIKGWKLVPIEPTVDMWEAGMNCWSPDDSQGDYLEKAFAAMVAASPTQSMKADE